jgi:hypothetical protein
MHYKHAFLLTFLIGLGWTGYIFAYQFGPEPAVNGIVSGQTCNQAGCHNSFPINSSSGSVSISGLPAGWVAGQIYPLTVTVQRTGQLVFGFQLSAVVDATNKQAGSFAVANDVQIICGTLTSVQESCSTTGAIQFAEHSFPLSGTGGTGKFTFNWTAPSDSTLGTVRFNVAGNAANGDGQQTGDYIFTNSYKVPVVDLSTHAYTIVDRGGSSVITNGSGTTAQSGYARIQPNAGATTPAGVAIFGYRPSNVLLSETSVPATARVTAATIYAEVSSTSGTTLNTGLAIANPNSSPANINFFYTDATGTRVGTGSLQVLANQQTVGFLNSPPFNVPGTTFQGTFSFTSDQPVGVLALRGLLNERNEFLMSTLPVIDTTQPPNSGTIVIPDFADGSGWTTNILLVNPTASAMSGSVQFVDTGGNPATLTIVGKTPNTSFAYSIPANSSVRLSTDGTSPGPKPAGGSVKVVPSGGGAAPTALVVFSYKPANVTVSEAGVPVAGGTAFRIYVETNLPNVDTGIAVANTSPSAAALTLDLTDLNGSPVATTIISLPAFGQTSQFFSTLFTQLPNPFKGVLRVTTNSSGISIVGVRTHVNERNDFLVTTIPPSNEAAPATSSELLFPDLANGGGYTSQFIVFSGTAGQAASGNLRFVKPDGTAFQLSVN